MGNHRLNKHWMCQPLHQNAKGQQSTPPCRHRPGTTRPSSSGLIHRMLDVPRGCAPSPGGSGRASETAQVRGLGYSVSRRPAAGTPAPPAPDTPQSQAWQARHPLDGGLACCTAALAALEYSRRGNLEGTVNGNLQIWSLSSSIPWASCSGERFEGRRWTPEHPQKEWVSPTATLVLGLVRDYAFMPRFQVPRLLGGYPRKEVGLRLNALPAWRPERQTSSLMYHSKVSRRLV